MATQQLNANVVINTDADQINIAESGPDPYGALPPIANTPGGVVSVLVRQGACKIVEDGEGASQERARRLHVRLKRKRSRSVGSGGGKDADPSPTKPRAIG